MPKVPKPIRQFFRRRQPPTALWRLVGMLVIKSLNAWMSTLSYRAARYDATVDPADAQFIGPAIYILWHETIPLPLFLRPNCRLSMLLSQHQDAEVLSHVGHFAGFQVVRGSSNRGGTAALRQLIERGRGMSLAITPDGPRGPRRVMAQGCVYLSSRLQIPIVPIAVGYDRPWRNRSSWDKFAFPRPFSRCRAILGPRLQMPPDIEKGDIEHYRQWVESQLAQLTELAEAWAERRCDVRGSEILYRQPQSAHARPASLSARSCNSTTHTDPLAKPVACPP